MDTKPFDPTKPVQTRDGNKARILCTDRVSAVGWPIIALHTRTGQETVELHRRDGSWGTRHGEDHPNDLVNIPERVVRWVNLYEATVGRTGSYCSRAAADACAGNNRIACVRVEFEPGQFDT